MQKSRCILGAKTTIILPPIRISKIVFYSNCVHWDYRQYQAPFSRKEYIIWIFIDFKNAFDTVDHEIILRKLHCYGFTVANGVQSDIGFVKCGVLKGSVLGTLFFKLCINDIYRAVGCNAVSLFADDKINFVLFHMKNKRAPNDFDSIQTNHMTTRMVKIVNYLGLVMDKHFYWNAHANFVCASLVKY